MTSSDLVIIGAGPAGIAAAITAAKLGAKVTLLDEQPQPGGQIYRHSEPPQAHILGKEHLHGKKLIEQLQHKNITLIPNAAVWAIEGQFLVSFLLKNQSTTIHAKTLLLATGALERPMPLPGWTLPGVMTVGAGQILLKQSGLLAKNAVLVGTGPLLYLFASQMIRAKQPPLALVETQKTQNLLQAIPHIHGLLHNRKFLAQGLSLIQEIQKACVPRYKGAHNISIKGHAFAENLSFQSKGKKYNIPCQTVYLHHGLIPHVHAALSIGVEQRWDSTQKTFTPIIDPWGETHIKNLFIAGDSSRIQGAEIAEIEGQIAALKISEKLGLISEKEKIYKAKPLHNARKKERSFRNFLSTAFPPYPCALSPHNATLVCRCEEVNAGTIRQSTKLGCSEINQVKALTRAGMGVCQGRYCGTTVSAILSEELKQSHNQTGYFRTRPPIKPVTLAEIAGTVDPFHHNPRQGD
jgi:NADPH-dependent 2,4-dienoyl-CoA reductase/sulfur reductase-like enzyme